MSGCVLDSLQAHQGADVHIKRDKEESQNTDIEGQLMFVITGPVPIPYTPEDELIKSTVFPLSFVPVLHILAQSQKWYSEHATQLEK